MKEFKRNIYKRKDDRYEGRYISGYQDIYGRAQYRSVYGRSVEEVHLRLNEEEEKVWEEVELERLLRRQRKQKQEEGILEKALTSKEIDQVARIMTLKEWMIEWLEVHKKNTIQVTSYMRYYNVIHKHIIPEIGNHNLSELTTETIQQFIKYLCEPGDYKKALSSTTVRSYLMILKSALETAVDQELVMKNPCRKLTLPPKIYNKPVFLEPEECEKLEHILLHTDDNPKSVAILLALKTGLRLGEVAALKWKDVDFDNRVLHIRHSLKRVKTFVKNGPKTKSIVSSTKTSNSVRDIPMSSGQYEYLLVYHRITLTNAIRSVDEESFVFENKVGNFIDPRVYQEYFKVILKKAKIKPVNFHALRHTFATTAANNNMQVSVLSRILGHSSATLTLRLYVHPLASQDQAEMAKIDWGNFV